MIVTFKIKNRIFVDKKCFVDDSQTIRIIISNDYISTIAPVFPQGQKLIDVYDSKGQLIEPKAWTPKIKAEVDLAKKEVKGRWKLFTVPIAFAAFLAVLLLANGLIMLSKTYTETKQEARTEDPRVEDLVFYYGYDTLDKVNVIRLAKITKISGDTIFMKTSKQKKPIESSAVGTSEKIVKSLKDEGISLEERTIAVKRDQYIRGRILVFNPEDAQFSYSGGYISEIDR